MTSKAMLTLYTILIVVLVLILFLFVLALILFRESLESCCCPGFRRRRGRRPLVRDGRREPLGGLRNPGFDELERPRRMPEQRPFDAMEQVESPPSYDEAVKQELFRFQPPPTTPADDRSHILTEEAISEEVHCQTPNPSEDSASACAADCSHSPPSLPSTSHDCTQSSRKWGSTVTTGGIASQLSTIREEDYEDWPVTVVIDCIGVQASRLLENCNTTVSLKNGGELETHSKC